MRELPPLGYRFSPSDEEIILDFLYHKIKGSLEFRGEVIDSDIYGEEEEWTRMFHDKEMYGACGNKNAGDETVMYFFTRTRKKSNERGKRVNRVTKTGTWKTQKDEAIHIPGTKIHIGSKRSFKFVPRDKNSSTARGWIMHEFRVDGQLLDKIKDFDNNCVICRIKTERRKKEEHSGNNRQLQQLLPCSADDADHDHASYSCTNI